MFVGFLFVGVRNWSVLLVFVGTKRNGILRLILISCVILSPKKIMRTLVLPLQLFLDGLQCTLMILAL